VATPQIPKTQQDALPLLTIASATGGDVQLLGNSITRFWTSASLNLGNGTNVAPGTVFQSASLDVRGCSRFAFVIKRVAPNPDAGSNLFLYLIYGMSDGTFPGLTDYGAAPQLNVRIANFNYGLLGVGSIKVAAIIWSDPSGVDTGGGGTNPSTATVGTSFRIGLTDVITPAQMTAGGGGYTFELWGASQ
jgi:hypothetical protein